MTRRLTTIVLSLALLLTNGFWIFVTIDNAITASYNDVSLESCCRGFRVSLAILRVVTKPAATRDAIMAAAQRAAPGYQPFEKDGFTWIGEVALKFGPGGHLVDVSSEKDALTEVYLRPAT